MTSYLDSTSCPRAWLPAEAEADTVAAPVDTEAVAAPVDTDAAAAPVDTVDVVAQPQPLVPDHRDAAFLRHSGR